MATDYMLQCDVADPAPSPANRDEVQAMTGPDSAADQTTSGIFGPLDGSVIPREAPPVDLHVDVAHSARIYDYYLGGKTNYPADREAGEQTLAVFPHMRTTAVQNRMFVHRAVRFLVGAGIDQFLDIGTGIPTSPNLHEIAQDIVPAARVVYVDNDPIVLTHARALLTSSEEGRAAYIEADLRQPEEILASPVLTETLDWSRPIALSLIAVLHFFPDEFEPATVVRRLVEALPVASDLIPEEAKRIAEVYRKRGIPAQARTRDEFAALVPAGMEIVEPGIVMAHRWRPDSDTDADHLSDAEVSLYSLIARKV